MTATPGAAVFLDRDGVLIRDVHYLCRVEQIEVLAGVVEALQVLRSEGFKLEVNQSVVARGKVTERDCAIFIECSAKCLAPQGLSWTRSTTVRIIRPLVSALTKLPALVANPMPR